MIWTIIINDSPYGIEKPWNALRLASTAASENNKVNIFLMGDSVASAKKGQKTPDGYYNMEKMIKVLTRKGAQVKVCGACIDARGLSPTELVEGVERGSMKILTEWITTSDKVINF